MGVKPPTLEEHLEIEAIKQLRVLYSQLFDGLRTDEMAMLFTEDAVCEFSDDLPYGDWVGRDEIREQYRKVAGNASRPFSFMHATTNGWVQLTGPDSATGSWFLLDLGLGDNPNPVGLLGVYNDVYKKVDGEWFIHRTRIDHIWTQGSAGGG
ncbi:MAG: nuclear transport factor 2 family protein [Dehalococcoidia bacterium]|nr:nuclear transport factor 2 family protein [Chloroflexota bacterium]MXZ89204.1 nuclear transport factor 2 family protein [Dehalococcoidia bacterium]MYI86661.1 nuclear transport factor 2 family protein [Dehalococcoidia bacterium]